MSKFKQGGFVKLNSLGQVVTGLASIGLANSTTFNSISIPLFGVPLTVITMAAGGALVSFAYGEPIKERKKLYTLAVANTFLASVFVAVLPAAMGWSWSNEKIEPALAAIIAAGLRWVLPAVIKMIPEVLRKIFRLEPKKEEPSNET